jgi:predicted KAP-like P-loop ATPase
MWNDNETNVDLIDLTHLVNAVKRIVDNDNLIPCTIGIFGDWGSGKSSLLNMVETSYKNDEGILTIKFNGWLFEGYEDAKSVLMGTILENIIRNKTLLGKGKDIAVKLLKRIDWFKVARSAVKYGSSFATLGPLGLGIAAISDIPKAIQDIDYDEYLKEGSEKESLRMGIQEFHKDFNDLLNQTNIKKLIIFIDDLDRCNPDTVIETLEAIKLFLYVNRTVFIISADERLIEYCVRKRFPELVDIKSTVSRDYLEKLIQHPIRISQLSSSEIETYINLLFTYLHLNNEDAEATRIKVLLEKRKSLDNPNFNFDNCRSYIPNIDTYPELKDDLIMSSQITPILSKGLNGNPRQCKRFLNMLMMRLKIAEDKNLEIEKRILAKIMLLEYFKPESFKALFELQSQSKGIPKDIIRIEEILKSIPTQEETNENILDKTTNIFVATWIKDDWLKEWSTMEPYLTEVDLKPYFYLTRDRLSINIIETTRMSSTIQKLYTELISESDSVKLNALGIMKNITTNEASSLFNSLTKRIYETENKEKRDGLIQTLNLFCSTRKELLSELFTFYNRFPEEKLSLTIIPQLKSVVKDSQFDDILQKLWNKWRVSSKNNRLAKALKIKSE